MVANWVRFCALCRWQDPRADDGGDPAGQWTSFAAFAARFLQWQWLQFRLAVRGPAGLQPEVWWSDWAQFVQRVHVWWSSKHLGSLVPGPLHSGPPSRAYGDNSAPHPFRRGWCLSLISTPGDTMHNVDPLEARPYWNWPRGNAAKVGTHRLAAPWGDTTGEALALAREAPEGGAAPAAQVGPGAPEHVGGPAHREPAPAPTGPPVAQRQMRVWRGLWAAWRRGPFWNSEPGAHPQRGRAVCDTCHKVPLLCPCPHEAPPEPWHWLRFAALEHDEEGAVACRRCRRQQPRTRRGGLWLTACDLGVPAHDSHPGWGRCAVLPLDEPPD